MIADANSLPAGAEITTDICVVGAGAAGLALARCLARTALSVCVLESGGRDPEYRIQSLARAVNGGLSYFPLDANRQRGFGGTTHLWAGWCRPLDPLDFERREWVDGSGWCLAREDLLPFYRRAGAMLGLCGTEHDPAWWESPAPAPRLELDPSEIVPSMYRLAETGLHRKKAWEILRESRNVRLWLHANVVDIGTTENGRAVSGLTVRTLEGRKFTVRARAYVVAVGAIETARLLLASDRVHPRGLGNDHDLVGRYFMEHLVFEYGVVRLHRPQVVPACLYPVQGAANVARLFPTPEKQRRERMLQACTQLLPGDERPGLRRLLAPREWIRRLRPPAVWKQKRRTYGVARFLGGRLASDDRSAAVRLPAGPSEVLRLMHVLEQAPNPESRVVLDDRRDALGMRRVRLEWRMLPLDQHTAGSIRRLVGDAFGKAGLGAFGTRREDDASEWPPPPLQGMRGHHMGTTRMDPDPKRGVVDSDCRVHGVEDLFVASSSVFPTSGAGTPTITIMALALRLAEHLQRRLH